MRSRQQLHGSFCQLRAESSAYDVAILHARAIDPETDLDAIRNIGIMGDKVAAVSTEPLSGRQTIEAQGLVASLGFIDLHSHAYGYETATYQAMDGVTTRLELEIGFITILLTTGTGGAFVHYCHRNRSGSVLSDRSALHRAARQSGHAGVDRQAGCRRPRRGTLSHPAVSVLIGAVPLLLYLVPVLGFRGIRSARHPRIWGRRLYPDSDCTAHQFARHDFNTGVSFGAAAGASADTAPAPAPTPAPIVTASPGAGFSKRMAALLLDVLLIGFVTSVLPHASHMYLIVLATYGAVMWKLRGSTIGGIVFDMRVVQLDGREIDWEMAIVRALGCFLSLAVAGLGFFWIVFDDAHQSWHDMIAGTVVVRVPKGIPWFDERIISRITSLGVKMSISASNGKREFAHTEYRAASRKCRPNRNPADPSVVSFSVYKA